MENAEFCTLEASNSLHVALSQHQLNFLVSSNSFHIFN